MPVRYSGTNADDSVVGFVVSDITALITSDFLTLPFTAFSHSRLSLQPI